MQKSQKSEYALRTKEPKNARDADQVEMQAILSGFAVVDDASRDDLVSGELDDDAVLAADANGRETFHEKDLAEDALVGGALSALRLRVSHLGALYPFRLERSKLTYVPSTTGFYEFCLALSLQTDISTTPFNSLPQLFERVVAALVRWHYPNSSSVLHTGFPRKPSSKFKAGLAPLAKNRGEWVWGPEAHHDQDPELTVIKDETLDFVVTASALDPRAGRLYLLGQCACGDNWSDKLHEPNLAKIEKWFNPAWISPPLRVFTTPYLLGDITMLETCREFGGLVFDRIRLAHIAETQIPAGLGSQLRNRIRKTVKHALDLDLP